MSAVQRLAKTTQAAWIQRWVTKQQGRIAVFAQTTTWASIVTPVAGLVLMATTVLVT